MADKTKIEDLQDDGSSRELTEEETSTVSGGQSSHRLPLNGTTSTNIDTIHASGPVTVDTKEDAIPN